MRHLDVEFAQVGPDRAVDEREEQHRAGALGADDLAEAEDDQALVLAHHADGLAEQDDERDDEHDRDDGAGVHSDTPCPYPGSVNW